MSRKAYSTDLSNEEWGLIEPLLPKEAKWGGRKRKHSLREILDAIFYLARNGNNWADLPHDFPPKSTVYEYFSRWRDDGTWKLINTKLNHNYRLKEKRKVNPSLAIIDSRSIKNIEKKGN
jgi:putative transposase